MSKGRRAVLGIVALAGVIAAIALARPVASRGYSNLAMVALYRRAHAGATAPSASGDIAQAEALLARALALDAANRAAYRGLGFVRWEQGAREEAGAEWMRGGVPAADFVRAGRQAQQAGNTARARDWYERAMFTEPDASEHYVRLAILYESDEEWETALSLYERALSVASFSSVAMERRAHLGRANTLRNLGRAAETLPDYEWLVANAPDYYWGYVRLGDLVWKEQGDAARAERLLLQAVDLDPNNKWAYRSLAALYEETGRLADAEAMFRKVLELDPDDATAARGLKRLATKK
ncbi:MAG: tetratricopeptide repeat protein [Anaerolineae bacterium]|nr:tetratricopeptide repeat protein [Anaerolineae bacterium]